MPMQTIGQNLTINQRNLYLYYLNHKKKNKHAVCFVPKMPMQSTRMQDYLRAIEALEEKKLITVDRSSDNYTGWIIQDPK
jgi:hypothetical protein